MMTSLATFLFMLLLVTALVSLAWDLTRPLIDIAEDENVTRARAEAARIAALPRSAQPVRGIGRAAVPVLPAAPAAATVRRPLRPALAVAA